MRLPVNKLTLSAAAFAVWVAAEGFSPKPYIPTKGDVPTIGHGSTYYEDGSRVKMTDPEISRERAALLARNLLQKDEVCLKNSLPRDASLHQSEFDLYANFIGQYGCGTWNKSTPRRELAAGNYKKACQGLLLYKFQGGRDCSDPRNWGPNGCRGVWTRQQERYAACMAAQ